jgi:hypothetical protein
MAAALELATEESPFFVGDAGFYHITLLSGGEVYRLPEGARAVVDVTFTQRIFDPQAVAEGSGLYTYLLSPGEPICLFTGEIIETYETQQAVGESYENATQGLTGVRLTLDNSNDFAVMLAETTMTGTFWTRVTDKSQLIAGETYMIISAEGNYALNGSTSLSSNHTAIELETVKGHTQYYTVRTRTGSVDNSVYWTVTPSGTNFTVRNQNTSNYLAPDNGYSIWGYNVPDKVVTQSSAQLTFTYHTPENCWRIANSGDFLHNGGAGNFDITTGADDECYGVDAFYGQDMLIFKKSDVEELTITEDVTESNIVDPETPPDKPVYAPFIQPSDKKEDKTSLVDPENPSNSIPGFYYSDKATSNIEQKFQADTYEEHQENDGKIHTDKSVIYMHDDYGAFANYDPNTFGVTLSALGQEYKMPYEDRVRTPIDVVFVLDVSGSMTTQETDGSDFSRAKKMVSATNMAIKTVMDEHPGSRVGIVLYSTGAWKLLPLGRYTADGDQYLEIKEITSPMQNYPSENYTVHFVKTTSSLKNEKGQSFGNIGTEMNQGYGTYTQAGIALGYETFKDIGKDITYEVTFGSGEEERSYIVTRQPVVILLSDGEPTHSTNIYMDVLNGPHYGDGNGTNVNAKGVHGYYTILSANYYKRMIGIHYNLRPMFFTVGMDINETDDEPLVKGSSTGDNYKRAVLNPTPEIINNLTSNINANVTVNQLKQMMNGSFSDQAVQVNSYWPDDWTGIPHKMTPVLHSNPYANDYAYADRASFGSLSGDKLANIFLKYVHESLKETPYGFILHKSSSVVMTDEIGEGMCVLGDPVLRFAGMNHTHAEKTVNGNVTTYIYKNKTGEDIEEKYAHPYLSGHYYDISEIVVTITTDAAGNQTVKMAIPDTALPAYTPELIGEKFYYEALPVRLIYQVGLTAESEKAVLDLQNGGGSLTFYTNRWENGGGQSVSNLYPSLENPFYYGDENGYIRYHSHTNMKEQGTNVTDTLGYIVDCSKQKESYEGGEEVTKVVHKLGNNGKLVFTYVPQNIDIPVEKIWVGGTGVVADLTIQMDLYHVILPETGSELVEHVQTIQLTAENGWKGTFKDVPELKEGFYAVVEKVPDGYRAQYQGLTRSLLIDGKKVLAAVVDTTTTDATANTAQTVLVTNIPAVILPETGGAGVEVFYALGGLLIAAALVYIAGNGILRRKEVQ